MLKYFVLATLLSSPAYSAMINLPNAKIIAITAHASSNPAGNRGYTQFLIDGLVDGCGMLFVYPVDKEALSIITIAKHNNLAVNITYNTSDRPVWSQGSCGISSIILN